MDFVGVPALAGLSLHDVNTAELPELRYRLFQPTNLLLLHRAFEADRDRHVIAHAGDHVGHAEFAPLELGLTVKTRAKAAAWAGAFFTQNVQVAESESSLGELPG